MCLYKYTVDEISVKALRDVFPLMIKVINGHGKRSTGFIVNPAALELIDVEVGRVEVL